MMRVCSRNEMWGFIETARKEVALPLFALGVTAIVALIAFNNTSFISTNVKKLKRKFKLLQSNLTNTIVNNQSIFENETSQSSRVQQSKPNSTQSNLKPPNLSDTGSTISKEEGHQTFVKCMINGISKILVINCTSYEDLKKKIAVKIGVRENLLRILIGGEEIDEKHDFSEIQTLESIQCLLKIFSREDINALNSYAVGLEKDEDLDVIEACILNGLQRSLRKKECALEDRDLQHYTEVIESIKENYRVPDQEEKKKKINDYLNDLLKMIRDIRTLKYSNLEETIEFELRRSYPSKEAKLELLNSSSKVHTIHVNNLGAQGSGSTREVKIKEDFLIHHSEYFESEISFRSCSENQVESGALDINSNLLKFWECGKLDLERLSDFEIFELLEAANYYGAWYVYEKCVWRLYKRREESKNWQDQKLLLLPDRFQEYVISNNQ